MLNTLLKFERRDKLGSFACIYEKKKIKLMKI